MLLLAIIIFIQKCKYENNLSKNMHIMQNFKV